MDLCHLKHSELAKHLQRYKGRVVLHKAVFTEQGASASRVAAGTFVNTISRLHGMAEEANDAVSACTHVDMSEAPRLRKLPKECPPRGRFGSYHTNRRVGSYSVRTDLEAFIFLKSQSSYSHGI